MVVIHIDTSGFKKESSYGEFRNEICSALVGNQAFINNDIVVSDCDEPNFLTICLGDDKTEPSGLHYDIFVTDYFIIKPRKKEEF